jgi:hypothetical protein
MQHPFGLGSNLRPALSSQQAVHGRRPPVHR